MEPLQALFLSQLDLEHVSGGVYSGPCLQYIVVRGDSLQKLARRYGTTTSLLTQLNHLKTQKIFLGQTLLIPVITDT